MADFENGRGATNENVARHIKGQRMGRRWTLDDLAKRLESQGWPLTPPILSRIENGLRRVDVDDLTALAFALEVPIAWLIIGSPLEFQLSPTPTLTGVPEQFHKIELKAWVEGDNTLTDESLRELWLDQFAVQSRAVALAKSRLESVQAFPGDDGKNVATLRDRLIEEKQRFMAMYRRIVDLCVKTDSDVPEWVLNDLAAVNDG